jgi:RimJ/RimL family protein N-acetyltransferase
MIAFTPACTDAMTTEPPLPTFRTARLTLRPRTVADTDSCLAMDRDPAVTRFVAGPWSDPVRHRAFVEARTAGPYPPGLGYWTILHPYDGFLGWALLIPLVPGEQAVEIGWRLRRAAWGQGYATEAARPVLHHGFVTLGLPEISAVIDPANAASCAVARKIGLQAEANRYALARNAYRGAA